MIVLSYVFILLVAFLCVLLPSLLAFSGQSSPGSQSVLLFIFGIAIAGGLLWSLVPRRDRFVPPGPRLEPDAHPRLFAELEGIAGSLNEPMPKEVYLIGDVNAWVADRGGMMGFGSRRVMGLGLPLMGLLTVSQFRAVLAHEFAHYYGGDTRLGPWVYKTKMALMRTAQNVGSLGKFARMAILAVMYFAVTKLLQGYFIVFFRVINLISRRQEYRADELAALVAGPDALAEGLRLIHTGNLAWVPYWRTEVAPLLSEGNLPEIAEGFARFVKVDHIAKATAEELQKELHEGKTEPYDTHPPLRDRIAALRNYPAIASGNDLSPAVGLLNDPDALEHSFVRTLNPETKELERVRWDDLATTVTIPKWRSYVAEYSTLLCDATAGDLPSLVKRAHEIGSQIRDPKGMLLEPKQRTARAGHLLAAALSLALINQGWTVNVQPGLFYLGQGEERVHPFEVLNHLATGKLSSEQWASRCRELGIGDLKLVTVPATTAGG
jgi:Zn-dependent protease with chaperone function